MHRWIEFGTRKLIHIHVLDTHTHTNTTATPDEYVTNTGGTSQQPLFQITISFIYKGYFDSFFFGCRFR